MSEMEKQITKEIVADAKKLTPDGKLFVKGVIAGLMATTKKEATND